MILDNGGVLHYMDVLEHAPAFYDIIRRVVLEEVHARSLPLYIRLWSWTAWETSDISFPAINFCRRPTRGDFLGR